MAGVPREQALLPIGAQTGGSALSRSLTSAASRKMSRSGWWNVAVSGSKPGGALHPGHPVPLKLGVAVLQAVGDRPGDGLAHPLQDRDESLAGMVSRVWIG